MQKNPSTTYLDEGLIARIIIFDLKTYFAYEPYFKHIAQYFRCKIRISVKQHADSWCQTLYSGDLDRKKFG